MQLFFFFTGNYNFSHLLIVGKKLMKNLEFQMAVGSFMFPTYSISRKENMGYMDSRGAYFPLGHM